METIMDLFDKYLGESSTYADKIPGIAKKAFDLFKKYRTEVDIKKMGFKGFNVGKATVGMSSLDRKSVV